MPEKTYLYSLPYRDYKDYGIREVPLASMVQVLKFVVTKMGRNV